MRDAGAYSSRIIRIIIVRPVILFLLAALSVTLPTPPALAGSAIIVPAGNRHVEQPDIPGASSRRTKAGKTSFDAKYEKVRDLLRSDEALISKIKQTARAYRIDPIHMIGAIVGEHTYNVDAYDRLQAYYVKAASYAGSGLRFGYEDEEIADFVKRAEFSRCDGKSGSQALWSCRESVWNQVFRGQTIGEVSYPDNRFSAVFFQPFYAGQTFGLGQINPLTALELSDLVHEISGYPKLDPTDANGVYEAIMDPDRSLAFMAAVIKMSIDDYRRIANMDISKNPGLTATLYNVGNPSSRASALAAKNQTGGAPIWPEENYYGWLINHRLSDLQSLL